MHIMSETEPNDISKMNESVWSLLKLNAIATYGYEIIATASYRYSLNHFSAKSFFLFGIHLLC